MKFFCLVIVFLLTGHGNSPAQTFVFQKTFGGLSNDHGFDIISTADGGYAMTGYSNSFTNGNYDVLLIKLDSNANQQWSYVYGGMGDDEALQLVQTNDGGFAIAGKTTSYGAGNYDALLIKTNASGTLLWMKTYGGTEEERLLNLRETSDHGFILSGSTQSFGQGDWDMLFIRTDPNGDTLWTKILGGVNYDQGTDAEPTSDRGFIFSGRTERFLASLPDVCLVKTNSNGDTLWTRLYGGSGWDEGMKVKQTFDGGYIVTGASVSFGNTSYDAYLNKVDSAGHLTWSKLYSGIHNDATYDVLQLADSGYIIAGETESFGNNHLRSHHQDSFDSRNPESQNINLGTDHSNVLAIRTTSNGDTLWTRTYGGAHLDEAYAIIQTKDQGFMMAAYSGSFGKDSIGVYLVKTDSLGVSGCEQSSAGPDVTVPSTFEKNSVLQITSGLAVATFIYTLPSPIVAQNTFCQGFASIKEPLVAEDNISIYPNPANQILVVRDFSPIQGKAVVMQIFDITEREVLSSVIPTNRSEFKIDVSSLKEAVYFLRIGNVVRKFVKL